MQKLKSGFLMLSLLFLWNALDAQVIIRCPGGAYGRCMPFEESALDQVIISDCDCDDALNIYTDQNLCRRTITLCADNPIIPVEVDSFDFPYYMLDPLSMINLYGPNLQPLVSYMDTTGQIDELLSADDQDIALILPIDTITGCATFDAWVPIGEAHTFKVFVDQTWLEEFYIVEIPISQPCNRTITTCYPYTQNTPMPLILNGQTNSFIDVSLDGVIADINVRNINITYEFNRQLRANLYNPAGTKFRLFNDDTCLDSDINIGFDDAGPERIQCPPTNGSLYSPMDPFLHPRDNIVFNGQWRLEIDNTWSDPGTLNSWELEICLVEEICGPYLSSADTPIVIDTDINTIMSVINVPDQGKVTDVSISNLNIEHTFLSDLRVSLKSPAGTTKIIFDSVCGDNDDLNMAFSDDATLITVPCPPVPFSKSKPLETFFDFNNEEVQGDWTLIVEDLAAPDGGQLVSWTLNICTDCIQGYTDAGGNSLKGSVPVSYSYDVREDIESAQRIIPDAMNNGIMIDYKAGNSILLKEEFEVKQGQVFQAILENCNN